MTKLAKKVSVQQPSSLSRVGTFALPDYTTYILSRKQRTWCLIIGGIALFALGYIFFHQWILSLLVASVTLFIPKHWAHYLLRRRRDTLTISFKQALYSLSSSLAAGRSVENGFREAIQDLRFLYPDGGNDLIAELSIICTRMEYGEPIEVALQDFSRRAGVEDITNFADVFTSCKRTGGDLVEVVRRTSMMISEKLEIYQEITVMVAQKRFESKAMLASPVMFLLFMNWTSPDYMVPLYHGVGLLISGISLLLFTVCFWLINKIMDIRV